MIASHFKNSIRFDKELYWRFWVLLGPFVLSATLLFAFLHSEETFWAIPLIALGGIFFIHVWHWRGFLATACAMAATCGSLFYFESEVDWLWNTVLSGASLCSLAVACLGYEEAESFQSAFFRDADRDKKALQEVTAARIRSDGILNEQIASLKQSLEAADLELLRREEALGVKEHLLGLTRDEVGVIDAERQRIMRSLLDLQQQKGALQRSVESLQTQLDEKSEQQSVVSELSDYVATLEKEKQEITTRIQACIAEKTEQQEINTQLTFAVETLEQSRRQVETALQKQVDEKMEIAAKALQFSETIKRLEEEKQQLTAEPAESREARRLQGLLKQLKEQFEQKAHVLDETRKELFSAQERGESLQRQLAAATQFDDKEPKHYSQELLEEALQEISQIEKNHEEEVSRLQAIIDSLMEKN